MIAQQPLVVVPRHPLMSGAKFRALLSDRLRLTASVLNVDKQDLNRFQRIRHHKVYDLLPAAYGRQATAATILRTFDLPITKELQECVTPSCNRRNDRFWRRSDH